MKEVSLALFASGNGTNALNIIHTFKDHPYISVQVLICNNPEAKVLQATHGLVQQELITNKAAGDGDFLISICEKHHIDLIILAGYLRLIPQPFIAHFRNKILNIHPSLLPKYGGKGMYGDRVHQAVLEHQEKMSGITIHYVDEEFDEGEFIAQFSCEVSDQETLDSLKAKIHHLEQAHFPKVIEEVAEKCFN